MNFPQRFAMKLDDLDDVMKILQKKDASPDLISSAFRTARAMQRAWTS